jgi:hypothetical protein
MLKPYKILLSFTVALSITGCLSVKQLPMTADVANQIKHKQITISQRDIPDFAASTPGKAMFGAVGAAAMISAGNDIISKNNIDDPANYISKKLPLSKNQWVKEGSGKSPMV